MALMFYKCSVCGNLILKVKDGGTVPSCCDRLMIEEVPESTDGDLEKHVPSIATNENIVCVTIGQIEHPMTEMHHIEFIALETDRRIYIHYLDYSDSNNCKPQACFSICNSEEPIAAYAYCNLHGLYLKAI